MNIDIVVEGDYISFKNGSWEMYGFDLERCSDSAEFLDWIFQLHHKTWFTPELMSKFLDTMEEVCSEKLHKSVQGSFCPWGKGLKVNWKKNETI
jgi:hypothetical protein